MHPAVFLYVFMCAVTHSTLTYHTLSVCHFCRCHHHGEADTCTHTQTHPRHPPPIVFGGFYDVMSEHCPVSGAPPPPLGQ